MGENLSMGWPGPFAGSIEDETAYHQFDLASHKTVGYFSLQVVTTGAGTLTISYELSNVPNPGVNDWPTITVTDIVTSQAAGSGFYQWPVAGELAFAKHLRLKVVATGAVNYTLYPNVQ